MIKEIINTTEAPAAVGPYVQAVKAGSDYNKIVKTTIFLADMKDFAVVNEIYKNYFTGAYPARSCVQIAMLPKNGLVEIECIAAE